MVEVAAGSDLMSAAIACLFGKWPSNQINVMAISLLVWEIPAPTLFV